MSVTSGFFNSLNHDRRYNAQQMSAIFDGIINDGVFSNIGVAFAVTADSGVTINIGVGKAWFNSAWVYNDTILPLTLEASEVVLGRIDAVVIEVDHNESVRMGDIKIVKGTPSSSPKNPTLANETKKHQYPLAYITRKPGSTEITQADITNMVGTSSCPYITGILQVQNIDNIVAQWNAQWNEWYADKIAETDTDAAELLSEMKSEFDIWFADFKSVLEDDVATSLAAQVAELMGKFDDLAREGCVYDTIEDSDLDEILDSDGTPIQGKTVFGAGSSVDITPESIGALGLIGGDMQGDINMNGQKLFGLNDPAKDDEAANAGYVKQQITDRVIYGKGKNLLKNTAKSQTVNGLTFTVNEDGSITVTGTATKTTIFVIGYISVKAGIDYICNSGTDLLRYSFRLENGNTVVHDFSTNNAYTPDSDNRYTVCIRVGNGKTVNETSYPMISLVSETDATYEPYYEGLKELTDRAEKLLWENASVESEFGTDSPITLPFTVKTGTMVCRIQTTSNTYVSMLIIDGKPCRIFYTTGNLDANWYRTFTLNGNQITVGTGRRQGVEDNTVIVPFQFYGYKEVS